MRVTKYMAKKEGKKAKNRSSDWTEQPNSNSRAYKHKLGKPEIDLKRQCYPGQPVPNDDTPDEIDPTISAQTDRLEPWFSRKPSWHGRDAEKCREYLEGLSDEEITVSYTHLRAHET